MSKKLSQAAIDAAYDDLDDGQELVAPRPRVPKALRQKTQHEPSQLPVLRYTDTGQPVRIWTPNLDSAAWRQAQDFASLPFIHPKGLALMPDVHVGRGVCVGSVLPTVGALVPAAAGTDLGCGMMAVRLDLNARQLPDNLRALRKRLENRIPVGAGQSHREVPERVVRAWKTVEDRYLEVTAFHPRLSLRDPQRHLGTLGGGNHFVEISLDERSQVWVVIHSGSRGPGSALGQWFIDQAWRRAKAEGSALAHLGWFPEQDPLFDPYVQGLLWSQDFALLNRQVMLEEVMDVLEIEMGRRPDVNGEAINCFSGETRIITDKGVKNIGDLSGSIVKVLSRGGVWVDAPIRCFGTQELFRLEIERFGNRKTIFATAGHRWIIAPQQRKEFERTTIELKEGDRLLSVKLERKNRLSHPEGVARGFVFGDGSCSEYKSRANFCGSKDLAMLPIFEENGFGLPPRSYPKKSLKVVNGLPLAWKKEKPSFDCFDDDYLYSWLKGYFFADGDVDKTGRMTLSSSCLKNLEFVKDLCMRVGVSTYAIQSRKRTGFGKESSLYLLRFSREGVSPDFFVSPVHRERFEKTYKKVSPRKNWVVKSVTKTNRVEPVYCAVVDLHHCFALEDEILTGNCHHNYTARETHFGEDLWITRKGAIRAGVGEWGVIPGSMGAETYIVKGKGMADSYCSCAHGAGRAMSRTQAREHFTVADLKKAVAGVECKITRARVDEIPSAYKPIKQVMEHQKDLVEPLFVLKQILCLKGD